VKSPFISLNVIVLPQKILGQTYEKLRIWSDLGTSEENLTLNLRKTFDQCSIRSFGSANYPIHPQIFPTTLLCKLPVTISAHPHFTPGRHCQHAVYVVLYGKHEKTVLAW